MVAEDKFTMDFIGNDKQPVTQSDFTDAEKLVTCPATAARIMRIAKEQHGSFRVGSEFLESVKVDCIAVVGLQKKRIGGKPTFIVAY